MKSKLTALLLATTATGALALGALAQTPAASGAPPPPPVAAPLAPVQPTFDVGQLPATRGTVKYFTLTPRGDVDGFLLTDGTQVHVPPHLSTQLVAAVRIGDAVTVRGLRAAAIPMVAAMAVTGDASGQTVVDMGPADGPGDRPGRGPGPGRGPDRGPGAPPPPGGPGAGPMSEVSGKVTTILHGPRGEANGAILDDGTVLRLPPPEAARLAPMLAPGQTIFAQGLGIANNLGRMVDVRAIGASRDQIAQVQPPPRGPGGPDGDRRGPPPPPRGGPGTLPLPGGLGAPPPPAGGSGAGPAPLGAPPPAGTPAPRP